MNLKEFFPAGKQNVITRTIKQSNGNPQDRRCPACGVEIPSETEYPAHEDQPIEDWNLCPDCGAELPWRRGQ